MRCDLANALRQAAEAIDPELDHYAYAYLLGEVAQHIRDVRDGKHTLDEFADFYMIRPEVPASTPLAQAEGRDHV